MSKVLECLQKATTYAGEKIHNNPKTAVAVAIALGVIAGIVCMLATSLSLWVVVGIGLGVAATGLTAEFAVRQICRSKNWTEGWIVDNKSLSLAEVVINESPEDKELMGMGLPNIVDNKSLSLAEVVINESPEDRELMGMGIV